MDKALVSTCSYRGPESREAICHKAARCVLNVSSVLCYKTSFFQFLILLLLTNESLVVAKCNGPILHLVQERTLSSGRTQTSSGAALKMSVPTGEVKDQLHTCPYSILWPLKPPALCWLWVLLLSTLFGRGVL